MERFSLETYLQNPDRKVITRDKRAVRILCTDANCLDGPILALVKTDDNNGESVLVYDILGKTNGLLTNLDLIFASDNTVKKVGWMNLYEALSPNFLIEGCQVFASEQEALEAIDYSRDYISTAKVEWEE